MKITPSHHPQSGRLRRLFTIYDLDASALCAGGGGGRNFGNKAKGWLERYIEIFGHCSYRKK